MKKNILKKEKILEVISHHVTKYKPTCIHNINRDTNVVIEYSQRRLILPRFVTHRDTTKKHHRATECCCHQRDKVNVRIIKHSVSRRGLLPASR